MSKFDWIFYNKETYQQLNTKLYFENTVFDLENNVKIYLSFE